MNKGTSIVCDNGCPLFIVCNPGSLRQWGLTRITLQSTVLIPAESRPVTSYLTVSQTGANSSVVENHGWFVAEALCKFVARSVADPRQWDCGFWEKPDKGKRTMKRCTF